MVLNCPSPHNNKYQEKNKNKHFLRPVHATLLQDLGTGCSLAFPAREDTITEGTDSKMIEQDTDSDIQLIKMSFSKHNMKHTVLPSN